MIVHIKQVTIFEWYDGFVSGLISTPQSHWLSILLAFNANEKRRRYLLMECDQETEGRLLDSFNRNGFDSDLQKEIDEVIKNSSSKYLFSDTPTISLCIDVKLADQSELEDLTKIYLPCIDSAVSIENQQRWL